MAAPKFLQLFIPRKGTDKVNDLDVDWRAIEQWAKQFPAAFSSGTTFYSSLTGPGETTSPGALTQEGDFTIKTSSFLWSITGSFGVTQSAQFVEWETTAGGITWFIQQNIDILPAGNFLIGASGQVDITASGGMALQAGGPLALGIMTDTIGFFGATPIAQQSGSGITTVAQVVAILHNYGLLS